MSKNYVAVSRAIVDAIGGSENITAITHCMTRLRLVLKSDKPVDLARLKSIDGVLGVVKMDLQYQIIIGNTVSKVYEQVIKLLPEGAVQETQLIAKKSWSFRRVGSGILDALISTMSPLIPAIIGASMVKLLAMILEMSGILTKSSSTFILFNVIGDGAFFFLPIMVAASAALKFKTNMSLAIA
ncbi:PTS transporter subunit EIIB, partial [Providencia stuartii]